MVEILSPFHGSNNQGTTNQHLSDDPSFLLSQGLDIKVFRKLIWLQFIPGSIF
jgi:hypothetical protein